MLGDAIRRLRIARGLSQRQLAEQVHVSRPLISYIEKGTVNPSVASLQRLAEALDVPVGALFEPPPPDKNPASHG